MSLGNQHKPMFYQGILAQILLPSSAQQTPYIFPVRGKHHGISFNSCALATASLFLGKVGTGNLRNVHVTDLDEVATLNFVGICVNNEVNDSGFLGPKINEDIPSITNPLSLRALPSFIRQ